MSKNTNTEEDEDEEEENNLSLQQSEQEETFYESLDRTLSSSNSSTSNSDDDYDVVLPSSSPRRNRTHLRCNGKIPTLPMSVQNYDAWISSESFSLSTIDQRRDRLLRALGLASDPSLSRRGMKNLRSGSVDHRFLFGETVDQVGNSPQEDSVCGTINGSKPNQCNSSSTTACSTSSIRSIHSVSDKYTVNRDSKKD